MKQTMIKETKEMRKQRIAMQGNRFLVKVKEDKKKYSRKGKHGSYN